MEYFDFDGASHGSYAQDDDAASNSIEVDETDAVADIDSLRKEQPLEFPNDTPEQKAPSQLMENPTHNTTESMFPFRAKDPCDFCRTMGFDCFIAKRGVWQNGCTCCISLYRECTFTHARRSGKYLDTLHTVSENVDIPTGSLTGKKVLKSVTGATVDDTDAFSRKGSARFPREAVRVLKAWLYEHSKHPYPTEQEKDELKERTGLKRTQISNWLANARRRGKVPTIARSSSPVPGAIDIPRQDRDMSLMTPMERWKHSPPEHEPAATSDIIRALVNTPFDPSRQPSNHVRSYSRKGSSNDSSHANSNLVPVSSASSLDTSRSSHSDLSFASAFSHRSSVGSMERKERRRRRKTSAGVNTFNQQKARSARIFQCTFCADSFPTKYDWQRHEKSLHLALDKWTCSLQGGVVSMHGTKRCVFCLAADPDFDHLESHNYSFCQEKMPQERTFYRKDHLNQHLRLMHNVKYHASMDKWRSSTTEIKSRCGFCGATFTTWNERVDHLAAHFKNGADMSQWMSDWGFEPFVQNLVENAMPPYLIAQDRKTLDPFKTTLALRKEGAHSEAEMTVPEDANCYLRLQQMLSAFIRDQVSAGGIPTDQMIQDEARNIIYGNADPWNQTCADNPVWLGLLKRDSGIETVPHSDHIQFDNLGMQPPFAASGGLRLPPAESNPLARFSVCQRSLQTPSVSSPGFRSPAFQGTGQSSAVSSMPGSAAGSYGGSSGAISGKPTPALASDWGSAFSAQTSSSSFPAQSSVDPLVQMGFEPEFLQRLNESYGELGQEMEGLTFEGGSAVGGDTEPPGSESIQNLPNPAEAALPDSNIMSSPIAIPHTKSPEIPISDALQPNLGAFTDPRYFETEGN